MVDRVDDIPLFQPGEVLTAERLNQFVEAAVERYVSLGDEGLTSTRGEYWQGEGPDDRPVIIGDADQDIEPFKHGAASAYSISGQRYDDTAAEGTNQLTDDGLTGEHVVEGMGDVYLSGERVAAVFDDYSSRLVPINHSKVILARLDGALSAEGSATASVYNITGGTYTDSGKNITVHDSLGVAYSSGDDVYAWLHPQSGRFYAIGDMSGTVAAHNLLSSSHTDTVTASPTQGDLVYGNSTPAWDVLALGTATQWAFSDGTDLVYQWINDLTEKVSPANGDFVVIYDVSGADHKKAQLTNLPGGGGGGNSFETITVTDTDSGYTFADTGSVVADSSTDTLTLLEHHGIDMDVDATNDVIRIASNWQDDGTAVIYPTDRHTGDATTVSVAVGSTSKINNELLLAKGGGSGDTDGALAIAGKTDDPQQFLLSVYGPPRATPADDDEYCLSYHIADDSSTSTQSSQDEAFRQTFIATDVTDATLSGRYEFSVVRSGTLTDYWAIDEDLHGLNNAELRLHSGNITTGYSGIVGGTGAFTFHDGVNSKDPLKIQANSPTDAVVIEATSGDIGNGRAPTAGYLHDCYRATGGGIFNVETGDSSLVRYQLKNSQEQYRLTVDSSGRLLIGTKNVTNVMVMDGGTTANLLRLDGTNDRVGINHANPTERLHVSGGCRIDNLPSTGGSNLEATATGVLTFSSSDERLKNVIGPIVGERKILNEIEPVMFEFKTADELDKSSLPKGFDAEAWDPNPGVHHGFIAQQVLPVFPDAVTQNPDGVMSINYKSLIALLWAVVQEHDRVLSQVPQVQGLLNNDDPMDYSGQWEERNNKVEAILTSERQRDRDLDVDEWARDLTEWWRDGSADQMPLLAL